MTWSGPPLGLAPDAGEAGEVFGIFQHEGMGGAGIEPDIEDVVDFLPVLVGARAEEAFARAGLIPGVGAFLFERFARCGR